ncbi:MAG: DegT/DnrJ/EryC1/StrS family aminotransferase [Rhodohalobacter sp.]|nr:DegT/DnrJ/EryC1/StrS family aminotransferase [Rhodohalobacter sp.]MDZ7755176.1 DegT/DnrJ/EryC1/StrS family aminotransferase [Rhodohalobacter sp.]
MIFESESSTLKVKGALEEQDIFPRRYFYPSLDVLDYVKTEEVPVSKDISKRILCLPLYFDLVDADQEIIVQIINTSIAE